MNVLFGLELEKAEEAVVQYIEKHSQWKFTFQPLVICNYHALIFNSLLFSFQLNQGRNAISFFSFVFSHILKILGLLNVTIMNGVE